MLDPKDYTSEALPTAQDVLDVVQFKTGSAIIGANARLLHQDFTPYILPAPQDENDPSSISGYIEDVSTSSNATQDIHHQATFKLREYPGIGQFNTMRDLVQLYTVYYDQRTKRPILEVPIGIFGFQIPDRTIADSGNLWDITGYDLTQRIVRCGTMLNTYIVPQGTNIVEAVKALLMMDFLPPSQGGRAPLLEHYSGTGINAITTTPSGAPPPTGTRYSAQGWPVFNPLSGCVPTGTPGVYHRLVPWSNGSVDMIYNADGGMLIDSVTGGPINPWNNTPMALQFHAPSAQYYWMPAVGIPGYSTPTVVNALSMKDGTNDVIGFSSKYVKFFAVSPTQTIDPPNQLCDPTTGLLASVYPNYFEQLGGDGGTPTSGNTPQSNVNVTGNGLGYCPLGFPVDDPRSGCVLSGEPPMGLETSSGGPTYPTYTHPATQLRSTQITGPPYVRYIAGVGIKVDVASGAIIDPTTCAPATFGTLPGSAGSGWLLSGGRFMFAGPTDGTIYSGTVPALVFSGTLLTAGGAGAVGGNNPTPVTILGQPGWPDPNHPAITPSGCDAIGPNFPPERIKIEPSPLTANLAIRGDSKLNLLAFINTLLKSINYWPIWIDPHGYVRSGPIAYESGVVPPRSYDFTTGTHGIVYSPVVVKINDQTAIANVIAVRSENNKTAPFKAVRYNRSARSYISIDALGYPIKREFQDDNLTTQALVDARADIETEFAALGAESAEWSMHPWPFFEAHDVFGLNVWSPDGHTIEVDSSINPFVLSQFDHNIRARQSHVVAGRFVPL